MDHSIATHNGVVTIFNTKTGNHRTFRIHTQPDDAEFAPGRRIVSQLAGPDNTHDYRSFGFVRDDGTIMVWKKKRGGNYEIYARMLEHPEIFEAKGAVYHFSTVCRRCNRTLTTPESIESGIGPICAGHEALVGV